MTTLANYEKIYMIIGHVVASTGESKTMDIYGGDYDDYSVYDSVTVDVYNA